MKISGQGQTEQVDLESDADFSAIDRFARGRIVVDAKFGRRKGPCGARPGLDLHVAGIDKGSLPRLTSGPIERCADPAHLLRGERTFPTTLGLSIRIAAGDVAV
jgi:hypothetical protein